MVHTFGSKVMHYIVQILNYQTGMRNCFSNKLTLVARVNLYTEIPSGPGTVTPNTSP